MIGDVKQKTGSKAAAFKAKNSKGRSYKTIAPGKDMLDDGGDSLTHAPAQRATKGQKPGVGSKDKQSPGKQQSRQLATLDAWCQGKRSSYK
jgi:hypothetical protein